MDTKIEKKEEGKENFFLDVIKFTIISVVIVLPIRLFIAQPFIVSGSSMDPTFKDGHYLIIDEISYRFENPKRNDVIVFKYPKDPSKYFIKRVIGLPGETVVIQTGKVTIKNQENLEGFELNETYLEDKTSGDIYTELKNNEYFVMGDNRDQSSDSRVWGVLPENLITGRAFIRLFPFSKIGLFPGDITN